MRRIAELENESPKSAPEWWLRSPHPIQAQPMGIIEQLDALAATGRISEEEYHSVMAKWGGADGENVNKLRNWRTDLADMLRKAQENYDHGLKITARIVELEKRRPGQAKEWWRLMAQHPILPLSLTERLEYLGSTGRISREEYLGLIERLCDCRVFER